MLWASFHNMLLAMHHTSLLNAYQCFSSRTRHFLGSNYMIPTINCVPNIRIKRVGKETLKLDT